MADRQDFEVDLDVFSGPFSVLLSMIAKKRLDVTEVALAAVTDEFIDFVRAREGANLDQMSEFVVVASTLLALKAARLLPGHTEDSEDAELLEERDLLFAKLLQYKAFKEVAGDLRTRLVSRAFGRDVPVEERLLDALRAVHLGLTVGDLALLAATAFARDTSEPQVEISHLHFAEVPVEQEMRVVEERLARGTLSFSELCSDAPTTATVVARFLALLTLLRRRAVVAEQAEPLGPLMIRATPEEDTGARDGQSEWDA